MNAKKIEDHICNLREQFDCVGREYGHTAISLFPIPGVLQRFKWANHHPSCLLCACRNERDRVRDMMDQIRTRMALLDEGDRLEIVWSYVQKGGAA